MGDWASWVIDEEMASVRRVARGLGIRVEERRRLNLLDAQSVFFGSQFDLLGRATDLRSHRVATAYFHGKPGTGYPDFDTIYERLRQTHERLSRIQVSHREMREIVLESGIAPDKVHLIPIGIELALFALRTQASCAEARRTLGLPLSVPVIGSFQKDGVGWGEGLEPKAIKGPDVFVDVAARLVQSFPDLHVLLSGPARGYVKTRLSERGIPYVHVHPKSYRGMGQLYQALDAYLISSRQEGGPKAVLESLAVGVPLVSTRVGQANDLIEHGVNGYLVDIDDVDGLAHYATLALDTPNSFEASGRATAEAHSYARQAPLWERFFDGFVEWNF